MRLLLAQQDKITILERNLIRLDHNECILFLSSMRLDRNAERRRVMVALKQALKEYGRL